MDPMLHYYNELERHVLSYNPALDKALLYKAYCYAAKAHEGQTRKDGSPSTRSAMVGENSRLMSSWVLLVSSMQSWSRAAQSESVSSFRSATILATARGWVM